MQHNPEHSTSEKVWITPSFNGVLKLPYCKPCNMPQLEDKTPKFLAIENNLLDKQRIQINKRLESLYSMLNDLKSERPKPLKKINSLLIEIGELETLFRQVLKETRTGNFLIIAKGTL